VSGAEGVGQINPFEDRRMWRLLLAQLHPDAGGDHELFLFASALKERACGDGYPEKKLAQDSIEGTTELAVEPFLQAWQEAMNCWASGNHEALKSFVLGESPFAAARNSRFAANALR
jgi:hypothetical protein